LCDFKLRDQLWALVSLDVPVWLFQSVHVNYCKKCSFKHRLEYSTKLKEDYLRLLSTELISNYMWSDLKVS